MNRKIFVLFCFLAALVFPSAASAEPELSAPDKVAAGADVEISVSEVSSQKDFVTIVSPDTPEGKYSDFQYPKQRPSVTLAAPEDAGSYEIRLLSGEDRYATITSRKLEVTPVEASVSAPESLDAGVEFNVSWEGPGNRKDFITIVEKDAPEGKYADFKYPRNKKEVTFRAPELPGEYEIRYVSGGKRYTLASQGFTVKGVEAELSAPKTAVAGSAIEIDWKGPDNSQDFVTIVEAGTEEGKWESYQYVRRKYGPRKLNKVKMTVPETAGEYEIRYLSGRKKLTLGSAPLTVTATEASLSAPKEVMEGAQFEVDWSGPDNARDYIALVEKGAPEGESGSSYAYVAKKYGPRELPKVFLTAPEKSGEYEVRYLTGDKRFTLTSATLEVVPPSAELESPEEAPVRDVVQVTWEGPDNNGDYIALVKPDSEDNELRNYAYTRRGKTLKIKTPEEPGSYELRYVTAQKKKVLASKSIEITPSKVPGELKVVAGAETGTRGVGEGTSVALILDASGSMLKREDGVRRIEVAKKAVNSLLNGPLTEGTPFAMRVFGHKEADSCRTDLEIELSPLDRSKAAGKVKQINAKNHAKTPIARSLELAKEDLESAEGRRIVILVTDGEETCGGDPEQAIKELADSGFDTRVNIVGFAIQEYMLKETFQNWARLGGGKYFDAANASDLERSILEAVELPYEVLNDSSEVVASGVVNGDPISVLPGKYTVRVLSKPQESIESVVIEPEKRQTVALKG